MEIWIGDKLYLLFRCFQVENNPAPIPDMPSAKYCIFGFPKEAAIHQPMISVAEVVNDKVIVLRHDLYYKVGAMVRLPEFWDAAVRWAYDWRDKMTETKEAIRLE